MCKVLVTCYITLMLVIAANGMPLFSQNTSSIDYAIRDVIELKKMNLIAENDFYTPEDFTNEERRMQALAVYMAEMGVLQDELQLDDNKRNAYQCISNTLKILHPFVLQNTKPKCDSCRRKNAQEFLEGLQELLQSIRKSISHTVESN